ncbi:MAG: sulfite exporter TauE/SafE family protein [Nitratireductor sp.]|nr:sulfite exporter TauE/SafE family protein [Nitratireductor sp.]
MTEFLLFLAVGFLAQAVDGALGMAYGVISSTVLISSGISPAHASAAVHAAEVFTTGASGLSHHYYRNIDWKLFARLAPFGVLGGCLGAYVLTTVDASVMRPVVTTYLALVGVWLFVRSFRKIPARPVPAAMTAPLGAVGGFLDAAGGGGWGPIVTTGLLGAGGAPRYVIGTVNASEFLITISVSLSFLAAMLTGHWEEGGGLSVMLPAIAGLIVGGLFAAPLAGLLVRNIRENVLLRAVGILIILLASYQTWQALA